MTKVVTFEHRGIRCAIPARQALDLTALANGEALVHLWSGPDCVISRAMRVVTRSGIRQLLCGDVRIEELDTEGALALSHVLRAATDDLPHVVGLANIGSHPVWLVDLSRFAGPEQSDGE